MPNAKLIKDDGLILVLPASSITAVCSVLKAGEAPPKNPSAKTVVFSTFRGFSIFFLAMTGREAFDAIADKDDTSRDWLELPIGEDATYLSPDRISMVEGVKLPDGDLGLRVWFVRPDMQEAFADVDHDDDLLEQLIGLVGKQDDGEPDEPPGPPVLLRKPPTRRHKR